jgi:hypothetical protein
MVWSLRTVQVSEWDDYRRLDLCLTAMTLHLDFWTLRWLFEACT